MKSAIAFAPLWHITSARPPQIGAMPAPFHRPPDRLASPHAGRARFLVRFRLDLLLSGGGADRGAWPRAPTCACASGRSCSGRSSRHRVGPRRRSISIRRRAATCGATSSGCARTWTLPFRRPDPFPQNSLLAARVALVALDRRLGRGLLRRAVPRAVRRRPPDRRRRRPRRHACELCRSIRRPCSPRPDRMQTRRGCARRPRRRSGSACSARRASRPRMGNCSGATTGSKLRCGGRADRE